MRIARLLTVLLACVPLVLPGVPAQVRAQETFTVGEIRVVGLESVELITVLSSISIAHGDTVGPKQIAETIKELYATRLFRDVGIDREGSTLVITVAENQTINTIRFSGMENLTEERVLELLERNDIAPGRLFSRGTADLLTRIIESSYSQVSRYLAVARVTTVPLERNRVDIVIDVSESREARVKSIRIRGATAYSQDDLLDKFELKRSGIINTFFDRDVLKDETLNGDIERLRSHYLDNGFIRFAVLSADARLDADTSSFDIEIVISEGALYKFAEPIYEGINPLPPEILEERLTYQPGEIFSDASSVEYARELRDALRDRGYAFAEVTDVTEIDDETQQVVIVYKFNPGRIAVVGRIEFTGNNETPDHVLRRRMTLIESEIYSRAKLESSLTLLRRTGFLRTVRASEKKVTDDRVDIEIYVDEINYGSLLLGAGYSSSSGVSFNASINRNNIFGSGNDFSASIYHSTSSNRFNLSFKEAFITDTGIDRELNLFYATKEPSLTGTFSYDLDRYGGGLTYDIPISNDWSWSAGAEAEKLELHRPQDILNSATTRDSNKAGAYVKKHGGDAISFRYLASLQRDTRDRAFLASSGSLLKGKLSFFAPPGELQYYETELSGSVYHEPVENLIVEGRSLVRYGNSYGSGVFPFFSRYYLSSFKLRGFEAYRIGPVDESGNSIGGQFLTELSFETSSNFGFAEQNLRIGTFMDVAGLWDTPSDFDFDEMRASVGGFLSLRTPFAPLKFSYGFPILKKPDDRVQSFQFQLGF